MELEEKSQNSYGLLIVTAALIFVTVMIAFVAKPLINTNKKLSLERKQALADLSRYTKKKEILTGIKDDAAKYGKLVTMKDVLLKAIPETDDQANTLTQVNGISTELKLSTKTVTEEPPVDNQAALDALLDPSLHEVPLTIVSGGTYAALIDTFDRFEKNLRLFNIKKISLKPMDGKLDYDLSISTYYRDEVQLEDK